MEKKTIGSFMAALRKSNGMTQQEVADHLCVSNKTVSKWEREESYPDISLIPVIAELFGVSSDEILRGERISQATSGKADLRSEKQMKRIINSNITRFKGISYLALLLVLIALIALFTISFSVYRPMIGFGVFLILLVISIFIELFQINLTGSTVKDSEITEMGEEVLTPLKLVMARYAFAVFAANVTAFIFSLPFLLYHRFGYLTSVIKPYTYLLYVPNMILVSVLFIGIALWLSRGLLFQPVHHKSPVRFAFYHEILRLNVIQTILAIVSYLLLFASVIDRETPPAVTSIKHMYQNCFFMSCLLFFLCPFLFVIRGKSLSERIVLLATGFRNLCYALFAFVFVRSIVMSLWTKEDHFLLTFNFWPFLLIFLLITIIYYLITHTVRKRHS